MSHRALPALPLLLALLAGCYSIRYHRRIEPDEASTTSTWHHGALSGLIDISGPMPVDQSCPGGAAAVENEVTFVNGLLQILTGRWVSLWTPSTVRVTCPKPGARAAVPASAATARRVKMAVVKLTARTGVAQGTADLFTDALVGELRRRGLEVLTDGDIAAVLGVERNRQMLGCSDATCLAEIGGALGVDRIVHGSVGRIGGSLVVNLSSVDSKRGIAVASASGRLQSESDEAFLDALPRLVADLLREGGAAPRL